MFGLPQIYDRPRNVRLDTLVRLRWLAVFGQFTAVLVVHFGLEYEVPIWACLAVIALAALLNVALRIGFRQTQWLEPDRAAWLLGLRHRRTGGTALPHRRPGKSVFLPAAGTRADFGHRAAAAHDPADRHLCHAVRDRAGLLPLRSAVGQPRTRSISRKSTWSAFGFRSCSRSATSASTRGRSQRRRASFPTRWRPPNLFWRASSICLSSTA